jgi:hypothetical protein
MAVFTRRQELRAFWYLRLIVLPLPLLCREIQHRGISLHAVAQPYSTIATGHHRIQQFKG